ncbi:MAG: glycosyltransferase, partial [Candidatus Kapabacteria bacterium]|nr:glycosyltransferase [Candidatus Kapabacteria bacterium]
MSWVGWLCLLSILAYALRGSFFLIGAWRARRQYRKLNLAPAQPPSVSIVIPARNEERVIARCVESVMACQYSNFEVIVVNDRSTDGTAAVLRELQDRYGERLRIVHRWEEPSERNLQGKAGALHLGIEQAQGEVLLFTDADCLVPPTWIRAMVTPFSQPRVGFVAGFVLVEGQHFFARLQSAEWLMLSTAASAGIGWGQALGCFGNNVAVRARAYWDTGGYAHIPFSVTEDLTLQQAVRRCGWQMQHVCTSEGVVVTMPVRTLGDHLRQRRRWGRGGLLLGGWAIAFVTTTALFWGALLSAALAGEWLWAVGVGVVRFVADLALGMFPAYIL